LDDPVVVSNTVGTVTYATAGPDTRTTQLFINLADNSQLDSQGFAPFATVVEGMDVVQAICESKSHASHTLHTPHTPHTPHKPHKPHTPHTPRE
jgi:cyclophilin family peptidyl-prolyl cis-trans isomerase